MPPKKKAASKAGKSAATARRQMLRQQTIPGALVKSSPGQITKDLSNDGEATRVADRLPKTTGGRKKKGVKKEWTYTHNLPTKEERKKNGRTEGRNLITWNRKSVLIHATAVQLPQAPLAPLAPPL